uniref:Uncharacterized protein n=1 Tax=Rhizophora mucronata TaxID=61149 RepID=A0A2P2N8H9_RHIMU
MPTKQLDI